MRLIRWAVRACSHVVNRWALSISKRHPEVNSLATIDSLFLGKLELRSVGRLVRILNAESMAFTASNLESLDSVCWRRDLQEDEEPVKKCLLPAS